MKKDFIIETSSSAVGRGGPITKEMMVLIHTITAVVDTNPSGAAVVGILGSFGAAGSVAGAGTTTPLATLLRTALA